jgi:hypothetical protein
MAISSQGRAGLILPTGIATDDTTKLFFSDLVEKGRLAELVGFENEEFIFEAVHNAFKFCAITISGGSESVVRSRIGFLIRRFSQLAEGHRFFFLEKADFHLLNPNTGNCPIFRTRSDAELTKAIYRRVPVLWREATACRAEENPWRIKFSQGLFNMASDSEHFRTAESLEGEGFRRKGNVFARGNDRYLPLYEAKMVHQFDHRFSTYEGATQQEMNAGRLPQTSAQQKRDPSFVVQPRYWVRDKVVESAIPKYPEPLAKALEIGHRSSIQGVLCLWAAGYHLNNGDEEEGMKQILAANRFDLDRSVDRTFSAHDPHSRALDLERDYPLTKEDIEAIRDQLAGPEEIAQALVARFSPKWLLGWRDVCRATDSRTMISSACTRTAVGDKFLLVFSRVEALLQLALLGLWNSFVLDYSVRQKLGGTALKYYVVRQLPVLDPRALQLSHPTIHPTILSNWLATRVLELVFTSHDLDALGAHCGASGPPFLWDASRRFEIRCELDAAFFHLYLPVEDDGRWSLVQGETSEQLAALKKHFQTPRDAVDFILDQFPIVRQKDEQAHGRYRTKDRILEIYDAMLAAQRSGRPYQTNLDPPPGQGPRAVQA